jgi:hypothetical protein
MESGTIIAAGKGAVGIGKAAYDGWRWFDKWRMGKVVIDRPKTIRLRLRAGSISRADTRKRKGLIG